MRRNSLTIRIPAAFSLLAMAVAVSGMTGSLVMCLGPDGHMAVEFAHHEDHGPCRDGDHSYDDTSHTSCTDIPMFVHGNETTRPDRPLQRIPLTGNVCWSSGYATPNIVTSVSIQESLGVDLSRTALDSLRSTVLLI